MFCVGILKRNLPLLLEMSCCVSSETLKRLLISSKQIFKTPKHCLTCVKVFFCGKISPFLVMTEIENVAIHEKKLEDFIDNVKAFHKIGVQSFLTKDKGNPGGDETLHVHVLSTGGKLQ